ncbi:cupin domain-containing protein [Aeromicrobium sp. SMF47]|uniref:Cupin domain-containing protein n=1 Tax=Aeromicrobium yanjiei TaxID=2662028 RepID=A0A5Q2MIL9_9ACTN|nr:MULTISPECIES: cupin domain-containing protein [Aeromicrobium]MRJ75797.1 cupin domain-containing protein [Aeromicrobium yanjiei]MRK00140.1 cupin domain-containing protein [Aeromicrobium sp. S22]QGG42957.1 cupin domain-containing protein [Aeromicrobium yanjiei]
MYVTAWDQLPEVEGLPNNFRRAAAGREMGVNHIRWVHPTELPPHTHEDAEQAIVMLSGQIAFTIDGTDLTLSAGDVAIVPRGAVHGGHSIEGEAVFVEVFAPLRIENLVGFLGGPSMPNQEDPA